MADDVPKLSEDDAAKALCAALGQSPHDPYLGKPRWMFVRDCARGLVAAMPTKPVEKGKK